MCLVEDEVEVVEARGERKGRARGQVWKRRVDRTGREAIVRERRNTDHPIQ